MQTQTSTVRFLLDGENTNMGYTLQKMRTVNTSYTNSDELDFKCVVETIDNYIHNYTV